MSRMRLRRCPFCGGKANTMWNYSGGFYYIRVRCNVCEAQGKSYKSEENPTDNEWDTFECRMAASAWNMRAYDRIDPEDIDALAYVREFGKQNEKVNHSPDEFIPRENILPDDMGK